MCSGQPIAGAQCLAPTALRSLQHKLPNQPSPKVQILLQLKTSACLLEELFVTHYYSHLHAGCVAARSLQA